MEPAAIAERYRAVRARTEQLCAPLRAEDMVLQSMPDASPTKWHLAHTTWFFEQFLLAARSGYEPFDPSYAYLFNSYYDAVGERHARPRRGMLSRPTVEEVFAYRHAIDERLLGIVGDLDAAGLALLVLGTHHEQQHQELLLTDILHAFGENPLAPAYATGATEPAPHAPAPLQFVPFEGGVVTIGAAHGLSPACGVTAPFTYDNEGPRHRVFLEPFEISDRLVTVGEFLELVHAGGYERPDLWLSAGWDWVSSVGRRLPHGFCEEDGVVFQHGFFGKRPVDPAAPICHLSYYEADAYARFAGARLPTEAEWEHAAGDAPIAGNLLEEGHLRPMPATGRAGELRQLFGDVWEWTMSAYAPYPGFQPAPGAVGEYNGKFMVDQMVLRGGSFATSRTHIRPTYRNFFPASATWQLTGLRLARTLTDRLLK